MTTAVSLRPKFWQTYSLNELTPDEWEALCDGCGVCCLIKFEDDDTQQVVYTDVACQLLDCQTASCRHYPQRQQYVPDCITLTLDSLKKMHWLPKTCAYKRLYLGKSLPNWHHLITQDKALSQQIMQKKGISIARRCVSETSFSEDEIEERLIHWIKQ